MSLVLNTQAQIRFSSLWATVTIGSLSINYHLNACRNEEGLFKGGSADLGLAVMWLWRFSLIFGERSATAEIKLSAAAAGSPLTAEFNMTYPKYLSLMQLAMESSLYGDHKEHLL